MSIGLNSPYCDFDSAESFKASHNTTRYYMEYDSEKYALHQTNTTQIITVMANIFGHVC